MKRLMLGAITDEFHPDLEIAAAAIAEAGLRSAELRVVFGKNIIDLSDEEIDNAIGVLQKRDLEILSIASPILKCTLPGGPELDRRFQQDIFASRHTYQDQKRLMKRAFEIAARTGAGVIRVFSFWRTVDPEAIFERIVTELRELADEAATHEVVIGLENEQACNIATALETARVLAAIDHPNLQVVWDPANAYISGEIPYPHGYHLLPVRRIAHVHAKDCCLQNRQPLWSALGDGEVDWQGQISALILDGYKGAIHLETHWPGPDGDKLMGSMICARNLRHLAASNNAV